MSPEALVPLAHSVPETAILLGGITTRTVYNLIRNGQLVRRKVGSRTLIPRSSIEAFLRRDHATTAPEVREARRRARQGKRKERAA